MDLLSCQIIINLFAYCLLCSIWKFFFQFTIHLYMREIACNIINIICCLFSGQNQIPAYSLECIVYSIWRAYLPLFNIRFQSTLCKIVNRCCRPICIKQQRNHYISFFSLFRTSGIHYCRAVCEVNQRRKVPQITNELQNESWLSQPQQA